MLPGAARRGVGVENEVVDPEPHQTLHDPACGTAGFLLAAWEHMKQHPRARDRAVYSALKNKFSGIDIVPEVVRLAPPLILTDGQVDQFLSALPGVFDTAQEAS